MPSGPEIGEYIGMIFTGVYVTFIASITTYGLISHELKKRRAAKENQSSKLELTADREISNVRFRATQEHSRYESLPPSQ